MKNRESTTVSKGKIFLSYASTDFAHIVPIAAKLEGANYEVWWDRDLVGGQDFSEAIETRIHNADLVIVVWSHDAVASRWVRAEAQKAGPKILPVRIADVDPPAPYNTLQTTDLSTGNFALLLRDIEARLDGVVSTRADGPNSHRYGSRSQLVLGAVAVLALALVIGVSFLDESPRPTGGQPPTGDTSFDVRVASFEAIPANDPDSLFLKSKIERNFVELLAANGLRVGHPIGALGAGKDAERVVSGTVVKGETGWSITADIVAGGAHQASASLEAPWALLQETYRSVPAALLNSMEIEPSSLKTGSAARRLTPSALAYLVFLTAEIAVRVGNGQQAIALLEQAAAFDPSFASALWTRADLLARAGETADANELKMRARAIDPDHARVSFVTADANPVPDLLAKGAGAAWHALEPGLSMLRFEEPAYGVRVSVWAVDPKKLVVEVTRAEGAHGATAEEIRAASGALLVVNGGFFDMDYKNRVTPSGFLMVDGHVLGQVRPGKGSGVLVAFDDRLTIGLSRTFELPRGARSGVQSGPLLVDPGGTPGIKRNDFNRVPRTGVCLAGNEVMLFAIEGGISLYEFAELLVGLPNHAGVRCERALNLDGGPSTQVAMAAGGETVAISGLWNLQSAIQVSRR